MWRESAIAIALAVAVNLDRTDTVERVIVVYQEDPVKKEATIIW